MNTTSTAHRPMISSTASMLGDSEAHHCGVASASRPTSPVSCSASGPEWVPTVEDAVVTPVQRRLCLQCPARQWCLELAVATDAPGYWAGTTSRQRQALQRGGQVSVALADAQHPTAVAVHAPGQGSLRVYRSGRCRCQECRGYNTYARRGERAARARRQPSGKAA